MPSSLFIPSSCSAALLFSNYKHVVSLNLERPNLHLTYCLFKLLTVSQSFRQIGKSLKHNQHYFCHILFCILYWTPQIIHNFQMDRFKILKLFCSHFSPILFWSSLTVVQNCLLQNVFSWFSFFLSTLFLPKYFSFPSTLKSSIFNALHSACSDLFCRLPSLRTSSTFVTLYKQVTYMFKLTYTYLY